MAVIDSKDLLVWVKSMSRGQALPLDSSEVHTSLADAQTYATSPTAYGGQTIKVLLEDGKYHEYILQPTDNGYALEKVGTTSSDGSSQCVVMVESLPEIGEENVIYIYNDEAYFWDDTEFTCLSKPADITALEKELATNTAARHEHDNKDLLDKLKKVQYAGKQRYVFDEGYGKVYDLATSSDIPLALSESWVSNILDDPDAKGSVSETDHLTTAGLRLISEKIAKVNESISEQFKKDYEISHKPEDTLVDYRDKEIRIMCPVDTQWTLQSSGEGADANVYYIGMKAYAPNNDVVSFKEDLAEIISDNEMYYFEGNEFAGIDADGRKYSIVWLPVAKYESDVWTYYGANSTKDQYVGWYYSVEWYNANGKLVSSDCIRINLSNEECYLSIEPYYMNEIVKTVNAYTDAQIENKITEVSGIQVVEF